MGMSWRKSRKWRSAGRRPRVRGAHQCAAWVESLEPRTVLATVGVQMPDFALIDQNDNSDTFGDSLSPRDYLQQVSGWYFIHTT